MKSLKDLYQNHSGKISDKWTMYLDIYNKKLNHYQKLPRRIDRRGGARNQKIILKSYQEIKRGKKNK